MFKFRKIASVVASAVMVSSTVALAAAANYPAPFIQSGASDVAIVYGGADAANTDLVAASDISVSLNTELAKQTATSTSGSSSTVSGGDSVKLAKSTDLFNLGNTMSGVYGATVDSEDLQDLLADGTYLNDDNTEYNYEQRLTLLPLQLTYFADSDYKDKTPSVGFKINSNTAILNYTLDFNTDAESSISSEGDLADFETTTIKILGKDYYILDAKNGTEATYFGKFTLLDSANSAIVAEGETQTVTAGTKSYQVKINFIGPASVRLDVNGEISNSLQEGETFKLKDGTYLGVKDILYNSKDTGISKVEFSLGSGKLEIETGQDIELNDDSVRGVQGTFVRGSASSGNQRLDKIILTWSADEEVFIAPDATLTMPGFNAVKFSMGSFNTPKEEVTKVEYSGDDTIELVVPIKDGSATIPILYDTSSDGDFDLLGRDTDERLATTNANNLVFYEKSASDNYHRWFVATYNTTTDSESYLLSATVSETDGKNRTTIRNEVTGKNVCEDKIETDTCKIGDVSLTISNVFKSSTTEYVNFTAGAGVSFNKVFTKEGLLIYLPYEAAATNLGYGAVNFTNSTPVTGHGNETVFLYFIEEDKDDNIDSTGKMFNVTIGHDSNGDPHVTAINTGYTVYDTPGSSDDTEGRVQSDLATLVKRIVSSDKGKAEITYSGSEASADVFVAAPSATVTSTNGTGTKTIGSVIVTDSEISSVADKNLIVIGGSCINAVAAELLGSSAATCGADFTTKTGVAADQYLIQTFARTGGKVATLIAGYNAGDTSNAAKYLTTNPVDTTVGKKYVGTSATQATVQTTTA